jgi:predicted transcriptional regulator
MGREKKLEPISIRLDPDVKEAIQALARQDERSLSSYINRVLRQHADEAKGKDGRRKS